MRTSGRRRVHERNGAAKKVCVGRPAVVAALAALAIAASAPLAAQQGRDLLVPEEPPLREGQQVFVKESAGGVSLYEGGELSLIEAMSSGPVGVPSAATTEYKYDDGTAERFTFIRGAHDQEYAQRFRLPRAGTVASVTACFGRGQDDDDGSVSFRLLFYRDSGGRPGTRVGPSYSVTASGLARGRGTCLNVNRGYITSQRLGSGDTWLSVRWENSTGKGFADDRNGPGGTKNYWRYRTSSAANWPSWNLDTEVTAYFIRLGVDHGDGTPPPASSPDLVVESPRSTETSVAPGDAFRFAATVRNSGGARSAATTLRYYRSSDSRITTSDTAIGTDAIGALSASATDRQSVGVRAPSSAGTYYYGACVDSVSGESNTGNNCSTGVRVTVGGGGPGGPTAGADFDLDPANANPLGIAYARGRLYVVDRSDGKVYAYSVDGTGEETAGPDLVVESPRSTESSVAPRGTFRFAATVRNSGDARSAATTLRYYRSSDSRITTSDAAIGTDAIGALSASATDRQSVGVRAPSSAGTYYYGACVDSVSGESNTGNNCSSGVRVTVTGGGSSVPDLVVSSPSVSNSSPSAGGSFTLRATVRNQGDGRSGSTTLRYYRSSDSTIGASDSQVGTDSVGALSASGTSAESISLTAPSSTGTYYYGACVDSVSGESNTGNNCSSAVRVTVTGGGTSGKRYNVGDEVTTLPTGLFFPNVGSGCEFRSAGGKTTIECSRNSAIWTQSYRYTCQAATCRIEDRIVTQGTWLETRR